ncbi:unnamed protein product [Amoebophrya sp. A120]|nr:unnamed protein product [Amoebophrya sp. A120]
MGLGARERCRAAAGAALWAKRDRPRAPRMGRSPGDKKGSDATLCIFPSYRGLAPLLPSRPWAEGQRPAPRGGPPRAGLLTGGDRLFACPRACRAPRATPSGGVVGGKFLTGRNLRNI